MLKIWSNGTFFPLVKIRFFRRVADCTVPHFGMKTRWPALVVSINPTRRTIKSALLVQRPVFVWCGYFCLPKICNPGARHILNHHSIFMLRSVREANKMARAMFVYRDHSGYVASSQCILFLYCPNVSRVYICCSGVVASGKLCMPTAVRNRNKEGALRPALRNTTVRNCTHRYSGYQRPIDLTSHTLPR